MDSFVALIRKQADCVNHGAEVLLLVTIQFALRVFLGLVAEGSQVSHLLRFEDSGGETLPH
jgi:hypothetical protein